MHICLQENRIEIHVLDTIGKKQQVLGGIVMQKTKPKRLLSMLLTLCMVLTLVPMTAFAVDYYTLTIVNGRTTVDGSTTVERAARAGFNITASAAPEGKVFDRWVSADGVIISTPFHLTTWIETPAKDATVTATYKDIPETNNTELSDIIVNDHCRYRHYSKW